MSSDVFLAARDLIAERGWTQNILEDHEGKLCMRGAVVRAITNLKVVPTVIQAAKEDIRDPLSKLDQFSRIEYDNPNCCSIYVNDDIFTTDEEAIDFLERAAKWVASKEGASQ